MGLKPKTIESLKMVIWTFQAFFWTYKSNLSAYGHVGC